MFGIFVPKIIKICQSIFKWWTVYFGLFLYASQCSYCTHDNYSNKKFEIMLTRRAEWSFWGWAIECCQPNFFPSDPCCHGNEFWDKIGYNSACVKDISKIFASIRWVSGIDHQIMPREFFPERPSLPRQQNLGHNWLELGLRKRYIEDFCIRWGFQDRFILVWAVRNYSKAHICTPAKIVR